MLTDTEKGEVRKAFLSYLSAALVLRGFNSFTQNQLKLVLRLTARSSDGSGVTFGSLVKIADQGTVQVYLNKADKTDARMLQNSSVRASLRREGVYLLGPPRCVATALSWHAYRLNRRGGARRGGKS